MDASLPIIVAFETSGRVGSVALARGPVLLGEKTLSGAMRHAAELMPALSDLCATHGVRPRDIAQIYVSAGPGSFTGLRVAFAAARAIAQATGCSLLAVPTLDVLACNAPAEAGSLAVVLDAKRAQVYAGYYNLPGMGQTPGESGGRHDKSDEHGAAVGPRAPTFPTRIAGPMLIDAARALEPLRGSPRPIVILGEGIDYHRAALTAASPTGPMATFADRALWSPLASKVHALGWAMVKGGSPFIPINAFLPVYIRKPEAEEVWEKRNGPGG